MIDLALAVACSLAIGMIFKHAGREGMNRMALLTANYAAAALLAVLLLLLGSLNTGGGLSADGWLIVLGVATGALFVFGFFVLSVATDVAGMSLAIGVMRVSVVIPFAASWLIWNEVPSSAQFVGLLIAAAAFFMIARRPRGGGLQSGQMPHAQDPSVTSGPRVMAVLAVLFVSGGAADLSMKTFDEVFAANNSRALFTLLIFGVALLIGLVSVLSRSLRTGRWPRRRTIAWGVLLGLANYGSVYFILRAIEQLSGPFVFPANNISIVIGGALLGVYFWRERLTWLNWAGLLLAALALGLLSL